MRPIDIVRRVAPHARPEYLTAFEQGDDQFRQAGITTPLRLAHFLAQTLEETGGYVIDIESGNYTAARIVEVWPSRFHSVSEAEPYAHNAEKLFNSVYSSRMGNGPPSSGDGFKYRGRGILQTTGREAYAKYGKRCGVDFEGNPELIYDPRYALMPALAEWTDSKCNELADQDNIREITHRVNGGYTNLAERERWLAVVKPVIDKVDLVAAPKPSVVPFPAPAPAPAPKPGPAPEPKPAPKLPPVAAPAPPPKPPATVPKTTATVAAGTAAGAAAHQAGLPPWAVILIALAAAAAGFALAHLLTKKG